jgi:hypothetical protein
MHRLAVIAIYTVTNETPHNAKSSGKNRLLSLILHGPHLKRRIQKFFYCCVCIRYRGNVSTEPLPNNDRGIFTEPSRCLSTIRGHT